MCRSPGWNDGLWKEDKCIRVREGYALYRLFLKLAMWSRRCLVLPDLQNECSRQRYLSLAVGGGNGHVSLAMPLRGSLVVIACRDDGRPELG